jgi:tRNA modification GTPase
MGIERTMESIRRAQVIIRLVDARRMDEAMPEFEVRPEQRVLTVVNKMDAAPEGFRVPEGALGISARQGDEIEALCEALRSTVDTEGLYHGDAVVSNSRHYEALTAARKSLGRALAGMDEGLPADLLSEEIRPVIRHLGEITGQITTDEILGNIFSKFCIGK